MSNQFANEGNVVEEPLIQKKNWIWIGGSALVLGAVSCIGAYLFTHRPPAYDPRELPGRSIIMGEKGSTSLAATTPINKADYEPLSFEILGGYSYDFPNEDGNPIAKGQKLKNQIPKRIQDLGGQKIAIKGFMIPLQFEDDGAKHFILSQFVPACCFGDTIKMNQWIDVRMTGNKRSKYLSAESIVIFGTLEVGEELEDGYVSSIYRIVADEVIAPGQSDKS